MIKNNLDSVKVVDGKSAFHLHSDYHRPMIKYGVASVVVELTL